MKELAIVVPLKKGAEEAAATLLAAGPPFRPEEAGFKRHAVYLTDREALFIFEGSEVEWSLDDLIDDVFHPLLQDALDRWGDLVDGSPRRARSVYSWTRDGADLVEETASEKGDAT